METAAKGVEGRDGSRHRGRSWCAETYSLSWQASICQGKPVQVEVGSFSNTFVFLAGLPVGKVV